MRSVAGCHAAVGVLLVLVTGRCCADPQTTSASQQASLLGTLDQLWAFIDRVEQTVTKSVLTQVTARLDGLQSQLTSQISDLSRRLEDKTAQSAQLSDQVSNLSRRLQDKTAQSAQLSAQVSDLSSRLDSVEADPDSSRRLPRDCSDLPDGAQSGVHLLQPGLAGAAPVAAFCDLDQAGGNWTVIQRRADIKPRQNFYLGWAAYKEGFGELDAEFWWGLDNIWAMTSARDRRYELRIDLEDFDGQTRFAVYQAFRLSSESDGYRFSATNYTGDAGDGLTSHVGMQFSTKDRDHDTYPRSCAQYATGAWWYNQCHNSNLNGRYLPGQRADSKGVHWEKWRGNDYSLKSAAMRIRPTRKL